MTPPGVPPRRPDWLAWPWIACAVATIAVAVVTLWSIASVGLVTNDDIRFADAGLEGAGAFAHSLWRLSLREGRLQVPLLASYYLPLAFDGDAYFQTVKVAGIVLDVVLFAVAVAQVDGSRHVFFAATLIGFLFLQNSSQHSAVTAFPGLFTYSFAYLLLALIAFARCLERPTALTLAASIALFALAISSYELYLLYTPLFVVLARRGGAGWRQACRRAAIHLGAALAYFVFYVVFASGATQRYPGTVPNGLGSPLAMLTVMSRFTLSSLPGYFALDPMTRATTPDLGWRPEWLAKAALVAVVVTLLVYRRRPRPRLAPLGAWVAVGVLYTLAPALLPAMTRHFQLFVITQGAVGYACNYLQTFGLVVLVVALLMRLQAIGRARLRLAAALTAGVGLAVLGACIDRSNEAVAVTQRRPAERWAAVDAFLRTPAFDAIPVDATVVAPSLFRAAGNLSFVGNAFDFAPELPQYRTPWSYYIWQRSGKVLSVVPLAGAGLRGDVYFLRFASAAAEGGFALVLARLVHSGGEWITDRVDIFTYPKPPPAVIGRVVDGIGPVEVSIRGGKERVVQGAFDLPITRREAPSDDGLSHVELTATSAALLADSIRVEGMRFTDTSGPWLAPISGWYHDNWIGRRAVADLRSEKRSVLSVRVRVPDMPFQRHAWQSLTVAVALDERVVERHVFRQGGTLRVEVPLPAGLDAELRIEADNSFSPIRLGTGKDIRELSVLVEDVSLR